MSFKEPIPALSNVMDTNEHASPTRERGVRMRCGVGIYRPVTGALSSPDRAPSPTCPFIKNQRCQRAIQHTRGGQLLGPRFTPGDRLSVLVGDRYGWRRKIRQRRVGEGPYMDGVGFGQRLFAILLRVPRKRPEIGHFQCGDGPSKFKPGAGSAAWRPPLPGSGSGPRRRRVTEGCCHAPRAPSRRAGVFVARQGLGGHSPKPNLMGRWLIPRP